MEHTVNKTNWHMDLANKIRLASDGDTIICHTEAMMELAKLAFGRMDLSKEINFKIQ